MSFKANAQLPDTVTVDQLMFNDGSTDFTGTQKFQDVETTGGRVVLGSGTNKALWVRPADQAIAGLIPLLMQLCLLLKTACCVTIQVLVLVRICGWIYCP